MQTKLFLILIFCFSTFAMKTTFKDKPLKMSVTGKYVSVSFFKRSAIYRLEKDSDCLVTLKKAINKKRSLEVSFSPKTLIISSCELD